MRLAAVAALALASVTALPAIASADRLSIGLRASSLHRDDGSTDGLTGEGLGAVARFELGGFELEGELGKDGYGPANPDLMTGASDTELRAGLSLIVPLGIGPVHPFAIVGAGASFADTSGNDMTYSYLNAGGGLALRIGDLRIAGDVRLARRDRVGGEPGAEETGFEGRLIGLVSF